MHQRTLTPELMDDPALDEEHLRAALAGLRRLNTVSLAGGLLFRLVAREARREKRTIRVLDVACASGDWVLAAAARAARTGISAEFSGCDINIRSIDLARERAASRGLRCSFFACDAVKNGSATIPHGEYDVIMANLFLHHLSNSDAERLLSVMGRAARSMVIVNDLVRSRMNLWMVGAASRLLSRSPIVHTDAVLSVRGAFTRDEMLELAEQAGLRGASVGFGGLGRMSLVYRKGA